MGDHGDRVTVLVAGLEVFARHGVHAHERRDGQRFVVDLELRLLVCPGVDSDRLADTVDYATLTADVTRLVAEDPADLLEHVAGRIADRALAEPLAAEVTVTLRKPDVDLPQRVDHTGVRLNRHRVHRYWLGLGANLGDRAQHLRELLGHLREHGVTVEAVSPVYETAPQLVADQPAFLNAAARVRTRLSPPRLLRRIRVAERAVGRVPGPRFGPRAVDCDVLLWDGGAWDAVELTVPHPRLRDRRFALIPLLDLDPELAFPDGTPLTAVCAALPQAEQAVVRVTAHLD